MFDVYWFMNPEVGKWLGMHPSFVNVKWQLIDSSENTQVIKAKGTDTWFLPRPKTNRPLTVCRFLSVMLFQRKMQGFLLLSCFVLVATESVLGYAHMIPEEKLSNNRVVALSQNLAIIPPPVVIVGKRTKVQGKYFNKIHVQIFWENFLKKKKKNTVMPYHVCNCPKRPLLWWWYRRVLTLINTFSISVHILSKFKQRPQSCDLINWITTM